VAGDDDDDDDNNNNNNNMTCLEAKINEKILTWVGGFDPTDLQLTGPGHYHVSLIEIYYYFITLNHLHNVRDIIVVCLENLLNRKENFTNSVRKVWFCI
jgi:hypothetical protein